MIEKSNSSDQIRPIIDWVLTQALTDFRLEDLIVGTAERMIAAGYPLHRIHLTARVLHPIYSGTSFTWNRNQGMQSDVFDRSDSESDGWLGSPLRYMLENRMSEMRLRIHNGEGLEDYPVIRVMKAGGATDYIAIASLFGNPATAFDREDGVVMSWSAQAVAGWKQSEVSDIRRLQSRLAVVVRLAMRQRLAEDVVSAYLGADAGRRVLSGQIQRGDGEDIDAIIWFSDLRSSTRLAETLGKDAFLELLNRFFECTAGAVQTANGEILDYIGDSVLAIFPFKRFGGPIEACRSALVAGNHSMAWFKEVNRDRQARGEEILGFGIGLHAGTVMFGNIGIPERLKFSVVGPAANEAARIADKCRDLGEELIVSSTFHDLADGEWRHLGLFELRNVNQPMALFSPV